MTLSNIEQHKPINSKNYIESTSMFQAIYDSKYDFLGQSYDSMYPNLHKYLASMLPQIGYELLKEFNAKKAVF